MISTITTFSFYLICIHFTICTFLTMPFMYLFCFRHLPSPFHFVYFYLSSYTYFARPVRIELWLPPTHRHTNTRTVHTTRVTGEDYQLVTQRTALSNIHTVGSTVLYCLISYFVLPLVCGLNFKYVSVSFCSAFLRGAYF